MFFKILYFRYGKNDVFKTLKRVFEYWKFQVSCANKKYEKITEL